MLVNCAFCKTELNRKPSRVANSKHQFCDRTCQGKHQSKTGKIITKCGHCEKDIIKFKNELDSSKSGLLFCSSSCAASYNGTLFIGVNAKNYRVDSSRYRTKALRELINKCNRCRYDEQEKILQVHHIDHDRSNNDISNLEILCPNCHSVEHLVKHSSTKDKLNAGVAKLVETQRT